MYPLSDEQFQYISNIVYNFARINLSDKKKALVVSRLSKRIRKLGLSGFAQYIDLLENNDPHGREFNRMVDSISTNFTSFFREKHHLDFLRDTVFPSHPYSLNIWSAASSSGQEIYSILIELLEFKRAHSSSLRFKLFASDISRQALKKAATGVFKYEDVKNLPKRIQHDYFLKGKNNHGGMVKVKKSLIDQITFFRLNLMDPVYQIPQMDVIFLRNAIIYFDRMTKVELIDKLHHYIKPGGYLIIGHSESLSGISNKFRLIGKTIYQRISV